MIETYLLENLTTFARLGTLSAAAEALHVSQPALTRSMQKLEDLLEVPLFDRQKNRIILNEYGRLTADHAQRILDEEDEMVRLVRSLYRSHRTIALGSCAPMPTYQIQSLLTQLYSDMTISSEIQDDETLLKGLLNDTYQLAIFHEEPTQDELYYQACGEEHLHVSLPAHHPLAGQESLTLADLDGISILQQSTVGFWYKICHSKMPNAHFLMQPEFDTFMEIVQSSSLPTFSTDLSLQRNPERKDLRVNIPLTDPEVNVTFYLACKKKDRGRFRRLYAETAGCS